MIKLLLLIILAVAGLLLGPSLAGNKGYVLIALGHLTIEMTAVTFGFVMIFAVAAVWLLEWLLKRTIRLTSNARNLISGRHRRQSRRLTRNGLLALMSGEWSIAEKLLLKGVKGAAMPVLNYLTAAQAAQEQKAIERRDQYLQLAHEQEQESALAVSLTQARLQIKQGQKEQALATLSQIQQSYPDNAHALLLLKDLYLQLQDWANLLDLIGSLKPGKNISHEELQSLALQAHQGYFAQLATRQGSKGLQQHWETLPRKLRKNSAVVASYAKQLLACGDQESAQPLLIKALRDQVEPELLALVNELQGDPETLLLEAKHWLKGESENPTLLTTLGRLSFKAGRLEEAKTYLEKALRLAPSAATHGALAEVFRASERPQEALKHYRQGLIAAQAESANNSLVVVKG